MKTKIVSIIICSFFVGVAFAQETEERNIFAPVGAKWYYEIRYSNSAPDTYFRTVEYIEDTAIEGKECAKLEIADFYHPGVKTIVGYKYLHQEAQKVYLWDEKNSRFILIYDFSVIAGDSWIVDEQGICPTEIHADSVKYIQYSGVQLKTIFISTESVPFACVWTNFFQPDITERFCMADFLFWYQFIPGMDTDIPAFHCYVDRDISLTSPRCDYIWTSVNNAEDTGQMPIIVKDNHIYFQKSEIIGSTVKIYNLGGQCVLFTNVNSDNGINVSSLSRGVYFIQLQKVDHLETIKIFIP